MKSDTAGEPVANGAHLPNEEVSQPLPIAGQGRAVLLLPNQDGHVPQIGRPPRPRLRSSTRLRQRQTKPQQPRLGKPDSDKGPDRPAIKIPAPQHKEPRFSRDQLQKLVRDPDARHVHSREIEGRPLSYLEGWYAIAQANAIFGYAGWDRETIRSELVLERTKNETVTCAYAARVRIRVRAGSVEVVREGTGWGSASGTNMATAQERALKSAETDATKRALSTFGPRFGLSLYDKDRVINPKPGFILFTPDGRILDDNLSPEGFSTGFRQLIELCRDRQEVDRLSRHNASPLAQLRIQVPKLRNAQGIHFADLLLRLMQRRREAFASGQSASGKPGSPPDAQMENPASDSQPLRPAPLGPGDAFRRYTGQSQRRREPYPFPARTAAAPQEGDANHPHPSAQNEVGLPGHERSPALTKVEATANGPISPAEPSQAARPAAPEARTENRAVATEAGPTNLAVPQRKEPVPPAPAIEVDHAKADSAELSDKSLPNLRTTSTERPDRPPEADSSISGGSLAPRPSTIGYGRRIDKSKLWLALERRIRDKAHLKRVAELPCLICNRQPSHAHHLRFAQRRGMSQKVSDEFVVPLCALHHGDLHRSSSEQEWWGRQKIDPLAVCRELWSRHVRDS